MWIVRLALRRPYTFVVMSILIAILGVVSILTMPTDIFPNIDIPVVSVIWSYSGVSPDDMEKRIVTVCERAMTTTVNDIEHIESQSYYGVSVIKVFLPAHGETGDGDRPNYLHRADHPSSHAPRHLPSRCGEV